MGQKAQEKFDSILNSVMQSDWSVDLSSRNQEGGAMYVTWGSAPKPGGKANEFGHPLVRLSKTDMRELAGKGIVAYGM